VACLMTRYMTHNDVNVRGVVEHVTRQNTFEDKLLLYHFVDDDQRRRKDRVVEQVDVCVIV
jgi:hypothetical protein